MYGYANFNLDHLCINENKTPDRLFNLLNDLYILGIMRIW